MKKILYIFILILVHGLGKSNNEPQASENTPQNTQSIEKDSTEINASVQAGDDVTSKSATLNTTPQQSSKDSLAIQLKLMKDANESKASCIPSEHMGQKELIY